MGSKYRRLFRKNKRVGDMDNHEIYLCTRSLNNVLGQLPEETE
jgi:hypothetical protein